MENILPKIGISIGDLNGIGLEVVMKTFSDERLYNYCIPILYGSSKALSYHRNVYKNQEFKFNIISDAEKAKPDIFNIVNCWEEQVALNLGVPDESHGLYALKALEAVAEDIKKGKIDAIITAPVNKKHISLEKPDFTGQTEFFEEKFGAKESLMMLVSDTIKVALVTNHLPLRDVAENVTAERIMNKLKLMDESLRRDYMHDKPRIAVLALNPHAGDEGVIGTEDEDIIRPLVKVAQEKERILAFGPYAADGFFGSGMFKNFDGILAMYHDQGLVPFKALSFGEGVNFTAGLPYVRTSPDHGTAYDIAGKFIAEHDSFQKAVFTALDILKNRKKHDEMYSDPLEQSTSKKLREERIDEEPEKIKDEQ